jgi:hypothetical protein
MYIRVKTLKYCTKKRWFTIIVSYGLWNIKKCKKHLQKIQNVNYSNPHQFEQKYLKSYKNALYLKKLVNNHDCSNHELGNKPWPTLPPMLHDGGCTFGDVL